jgi:hypothetical protein
LLVFLLTLSFKMVRLKRSRLQGQGFSVAELGTEGNRFSSPVTTKDIVEGPLPLDNHEYSIDLYGSRSVPRFAG